MPSGRRIVFVTEKFPWPVDDGGQIRTYNVLANLAARFPVTLLALEPPRPADVEPLRALGIAVQTFPKRRSRLRNAWHAFAALFTRAPYPLGKNFSTELLLGIRAELARGEVAAVHLNHLDAAQYVPHLGLERGAGVRTVFDSHNLLTILYERLYATERNPLKKAYCWTQWIKMARYEPQLMRAFDRVLVCSGVERAQLHTWGVDRSLVVANGVDVAYFAPRPAPERGPDEPPTIVFTGALDYLPNHDGVRWFVEAVLPLLRERLPGVKFIAVGKHPPAGLRALARPGAIEFTGRVDDVRPYMARADVCVVPIRIGGGTRLKVLEALAMRLPVVATRVGAEGIEVEHERDYLCADRPEEFAAAVAELCRSRERAHALAERGHRTVLERYTWTGTVAPLCEWLEQASSSS